MRIIAGFVLLLWLNASALAQQQPVILSSSPAFCSGLTYEFRLSEFPVAQSFSWTVSQTHLVSTGSNSDSTFVIGFNGPGSFSIRFFYLDVTGTHIITRNISVASKATASFNARLITEGFPNELILTNYSTNSIRNYWVFDGNTTNADTSLNSSRHYSASGSHSVTLIALGRNGCNDTSSYAFRITDSSSITLPNIFTPNGDGTNDFYRPATRGITWLRAWIYNRYGVEMVYWDKVNYWWDGHTTSGEACSDGIYFIVVEAEGFDGRKYSLHSAVTLVR